MMRDIKKEAATGLISNILGLFGKKSLAFLINVLLIKTLSVTGYGIFSLYAATMLFLGDLSLGADKVTQRYFPMHLRDDKAMAIALFNSFFLIRYLILALLIGGAYGLDWLGLMDYGRFSFPHVKLSILAGCLFTGQVFVMSTLNAAFMEHRFINFTYIVGDCIKCVLLFALCKGQVLAAIIIYTLGEGLVFGALAYRLYRQLGIEWSAIFTLQHRRLNFSRYFNYAKYMALSSTGVLLLSINTDLFFISYYLDTEQVALYAFSSKIPFLLLMLAPSNLLFNVVLPVLINKIDAGTPISSVHVHLLSFMKINMVAWSICIVIVSVNLKWIIAYVFSDLYSQTAGYILFWFVILYFHVIKNVFEPVARSIEYTSAYLYTIYAAVFNMVGNIILIPILGLKGALLSTGLSMVVQGAGLSYAVAKKIRLPFEDCRTSLLMPQVIVIICAMLLIHSLSYNQFWQVFLANILVIVLIGFLFNPKNWLSRDEANFINSFLPLPINTRLTNFIESRWQ